MTAIAVLLGILLGPTSGLASPETRRGLSPPVTPDQRPAVPKPRFVDDAQRALRDLGHQPGPIDGVVGPRTQAALMSYQRSEGLPITGRL